MGLGLQGQRFRAHGLRLRVYGCPNPKIFVFLYYTGHNFVARPWGNL